MAMRVAKDRIRSFRLRRTSCLSAVPFRRVAVFVGITPAEARLGLDRGPNALRAHRIQVDANRTKAGAIRGYIFTLSQLDLSMTGADDWFGRRDPSDDPGGNPSQVFTSVPAAVPK
jgi:hypothetical protein